MSYCIMRDYRLVGLSSAQGRAYINICIYACMFAHTYAHTHTHIYLLGLRMCLQSVFLIKFIVFLTKYVYLTMKLCHLLDSSVILHPSVKLSDNYVARVTFIA